MAQVVEDFGEQLVEGLQPLNVLDHAWDPEVKLIDTFGTIGILAIIFVSLCMSYWSAIAHA